MRKLIITALATFLLLVGGASAHAGGSDAPTPYDVTTEGIRLPDGETFQAHGHVNVRYLSETGREYSAGLHFDPNTGHPGAPWIGESFIPWGAFGIPEGSRIVWVQIHGYNQHFGEGGQKPIPVEPRPQAPDPESRQRTDVGQWVEVELRCLPGEALQERTTTTVTEERTATITWDPDRQSWVMTWGEWVETDRTEHTEARTVPVDPEDRIECEVIPPTGIGGVTLAAGTALLLLTVGGWVLVARRAVR